jgi:MYXO-CTERM domain-containing protein
MPGTDTRVDAYAKFIDQYVLQFDPPAKGPGDTCTSDADCFPRSCQQSGSTKICAQPCDPAAMPSVCPTGTMCTSVDNQTICAKPADTGGGGKSGGCSVATDARDGSFFAFAAALLLLLGLRRRIRN